MSQSGADSRPLIPRPLTLTSALAAALALAGGVGGEAAAQDRTVPLLGGAPNDMRIGAPAAQRFSTPDGRIRFVFDRSGARAAFLQFDGDPEVHVLHSAGATGGGELYRDDTGDLMLRVTPHGGVTLYTRQMRNGAPVGEDGDADPLTPERVQVAQYQRRMQQLAAVASRELGRPIIINAPAEATGVEAGLLLDAAERAVASLAQAPRGNSVVRVTLRLGRAPAARRQGDALDIAVAPSMGYAGRPSTHQISNVLTGP